MIIFLKGAYNYMFSILVAMDENRIIGKNNTLPWHLSNDLKNVKALTTSNIIVLGRKNFESIGKPLPNRLNVVLTRDLNVSIPGCVVMHSVDEVVTAFQHDTREVFIFGGAEIYKQFFPFVSKMYITFIHHSFEGDTYFPPYNSEDWDLISKEEGIMDEKNKYPHTFCVLQRKQ